MEVGHGGQRDAGDDEPRHRRRGCTRRYANFAREAEWHGLPGGESGLRVGSPDQRQDAAATQLGVYLGAIDHVLEVRHTVGEETGWQRFHGMVKRLATAFALTAPREETREIAPHLAFFQRIAAMIRKRLAEDAGPRPGANGRGDIDAAVRQVIGTAVDAGEVIDLFAGALGSKGN